MRRTLWCLSLCLASLTLSPDALARQQPGAAPPPPASPAQPQSPEVTRGVMRTDASRLFSEAEQAFTEERWQQSYDKFAEIEKKYKGVMDAEELALLFERLTTLRLTLNLNSPDASGRVLPKTGDEEIDGLLVLMAGSFATDTRLANDAEPALVFSCGRVVIEGLTNALYFEISRADDPANPFRQGIFTFVRIEKELRARLMDLGNPALRDAVVGFWAAPEVFPAIAADKLATNLELVITRAPDGSGYIGKTPRPFPCYKGGAVEMTSEMRITSDGLKFVDRGSDASGNPVWGPKSDSGVVFMHIESKTPVNRTEGGLVTIDLISGNANEYKLGPAGDVALHFTQWTLDGTKVDSSRVGPRGPVRVRYPIGALAGLDQGMLGITKGTRRRIVIPPAMGYGDQGRGAIPPNATLVFDIEALWSQAPAEPPPTPSLDPNAPAGPEPVAAPPSAPSPNKP